MNIILRKAELKDAGSIVVLTEELGYEVTKSAVIIKLKKILMDPVQEVFVAENKSILGWVHIVLSEPLESELFTEIIGMIVKSDYRGMGIGTKLLKEAEQWAVDRGCNRIRVRTNISRTETRDYYRRMGFISKKTQEVFEKEIN